MTSAEFPDALVMSALDAADCKAVRARIDTFFAGELVEAKLTVRGTADVLAKLRARLGVR